MYTQGSAYGCTWYSVHEEIREQLSGVGSLLQLCESQGLNSGHQA